MVLSGPLRRHCANDSSAKLESCSSQQRNFHGYKVPSEYTENHSSVLHTLKGRFGAQIQSGCTLLRHLGKPVDFFRNFWFPGNQSTLYSNLPSKNSAPTTFCANWEHPRDHIGNIWEKICPPPLHVQLSHWLHANYISENICHYFWPQLVILLPKRAVTYLSINT